MPAVKPPLHSVCCNFLLGSSGKGKGRKWDTAESEEAASEVGYSPEVPPPPAAKDRFLTPPSFHLQVGAWRIDTIGIADFHCGKRPSLFISGGEGWGD